MVPDYGGYSASEGGRGKGGPRGAPPGGRMGGGPMGMRGGVGGGGRYWRNFIRKIDFFVMNPKQITKFTFYLMVKIDPFLQNFGKYK